MRRKSSFRVDMTGQRFGRLLVIEYAGSLDRGGSKWLCRCDCGTAIIRPRETLKLGRTLSCGCIGREALARRATRGGKAGHIAYRCWDAMIRRCHQPSHQRYRYYGARGISVCERWRASFDDFATDMGPRPGAEYSLDRIDNDGNYEPGNCRWATKLEQASNKARTRRHCPTCTCAAENSL